MTRRVQDTYTDEAAFWVCSPEGRLRVDFWPEILRRSQFPELRHRAFVHDWPCCHVGDSSGRRRIVLLPAVVPASRDGTEHVAELVVGLDASGQRGHGRQLGRRGAAVLIVGALWRLVVGRSAWRLTRSRGSRELARLCVRRGRRHDLHGRVSLGSGRLFGRRVQGGLATAVVRTHGILHACVRIVCVGHCYITIVIAELAAATAAAAATTIVPPRCAGGIVVGWAPRIHG